MKSNANKFEFKNKEIEMKKILNSIGKPALAMLLSIATLLTFLPLSVFALALQDAAAGDSAEQESHAEQQCCNFLHFVLLDYM